MLTRRALPTPRVAQGSYIGTKCAIVMGGLFLWAAFVWYIIFAAWAFVLTYAPPEVQDHINLARGSCITLPMSIGQMITDYTAGIDQLAATGQDVAEMRTQLEQVNEINSAVREHGSHPGRRLPLRQPTGTQLPVADAPFVCVCVRVCVCVCGTAA